ncbi:hypothetical protein PsYK624_170370 [Phanerochaete sordida]|uniref:DDE-1 domain-containing protein n=1 Tax=Phanerochaete sordida TaxID=48140 RepID=A0A9P3LMN1_9APHY|nr:hypothetical protein PsYK624_170370 [Phanerochaete sordida]
MIEVLEPYLKDTIAARGLPEGQKAILLLDCYPVHLSESFRTFVRTRFPNVFLLYIPANCTDGLTPEQVQFSTSLPVLRDASVQAIVEAWKFMDTSHGRSIVQRAWEKCSASKWNLLEAVVTSREAKMAYHEYLKRDTVLADEIRGKIGDIDGLLGFQPQEEGDELGIGYDDTDVPLRSVIRDALDLALPESALAPQRELHCVPTDTVEV